MSDTDSTDLSLLDRDFPRIAWDRERPGRPMGFAERYSAQHRYLARDENGSDRTLCGARIPWLYIKPGDGTSCQRCDTIAAGYAARGEDGPSDAEQARRRARADKQRRRRTLRAAVRDIARRER